MITDTDGYIHIIEYLTGHLSLFEGACSKSPDSVTVIEVIEEQLSEQIISVCSQNENLTFNQRNDIIREVDAILYDLEEILSGVINNAVTMEQLDFLVEFAGLIKNLFDSEIHTHFDNQS
ncbi:MAG: topoisomerase II [Gammaproteobacteria bacterium]|nr:MAG: topoisomerase II [Gammaproteobacteria bacterium]